MLTHSSILRKAFARGWWWLRQVSGDAAYELYLRSAVSGKVPHPTGKNSAAILSRHEFYLDSVRRKYSSVSRCC